MDLGVLVSSAAIFSNTGEVKMGRGVSRRDVLTGGTALVGLATSAIPNLGFPLLESDEVLVPFTDFPSDFDPNPRSGVRYLDTRKIRSFITPSDQFFTVQHYGRPSINLTNYRLRISGLVEKPLELSLHNLRQRHRSLHIVGFECSGNSRRRINPLVGNARWSGVSLKGLLQESGIKAHATEVIFWGADKGTEEVSHGGARVKVDQPFGRSLAVADAMRSEVLVVYEMNGEPLSPEQGAPVRLIVPGWYGVANVKWLTHIHVQDRRFMGKFMAREYVTLRGLQSSEGIVWNETSVSRIQLKSMVARVTRRGRRCKILGFVLNDGTPLSSVEVRIDEGPWLPATIDRSSTAYSWKLFTYYWENAPRGEHRILSRVIDAYGRVQPEEKDLELKKTRWENNAQFTRTVMIA